MAQYANHWLHGVGCVEAIFPVVTGTLQRLGRGTYYTQQAGHEEQRCWFHFPIPTPSRHEDSPTRLVNVQLRAELNDYAKIAETRIYMGETEYHRALHAGWQGQEIDETITLKEPVVITGGINLAVRIEFLNEEKHGQVWFYGAGGRFTIG